MKNNCLICSLLFASGIQNAWGTQITDRKANPDQAKPNIILIMCDDMGFSDLSCYGGEVHTPHIDFLAENGIRFSQFKNTGRSCPSRAALLTGRYQHEVGMGWMTAVVNIVRDTEDRYRTGILQSQRYFVKMGTTLI